MYPRINNVRYLQNYRLELTFTDGLRAELDFHDRIIGRGGVFKALEDMELFRQVSVDSEARTLVWPNGVDFCPDVLYSEATGRPITVKQTA
jgi:hypothetical protein